MVPLQGISNRFVCPSELHDPDVDVAKCCGAIARPSSFVCPSEQPDPDVDVPQCCGTIARPNRVSIITARSRCGYSQMLLCHGKSTEALLIFRRKFCSIGARCNVYVYAPITMMSISYSFASSISKNSLDPLLSAQEFCDLVTLHEEFRASYVIFKFSNAKFHHYCVNDRCLHVSTPFESSIGL